VQVTVVRATSYIYDATLVRVIDGDTAIFDLAVAFDPGFHIMLDVTARQRIRFARVNCPEHGTPEGDAATAFTKQWLAAADHGVTVETHGEDDYGRWLGEIRNYATGDSLNQALLDSGHAVPWPAK